MSELKKCTKCEIEQPLENFLPATRVKSGLQARCKNCSNEWHKKNYINNKNNMLIIRKNYYLDNKKQISIKSKQKNLDTTIQLYKNQFCEVCRETNPLFLSFHHKNKNEREYDIPRCPKNKLVTELNKTICLCHNHHYAFHKIFSTNKFPNWDEWSKEFSISSKLTTLSQKYRERWIKICQNHSCVICGQSNPLYLTFHHKNKGTAKYCITNCPDARLDEELSKCICLCFNHHYAFHRIYSTTTFPNWDDIVEEFKEKLSNYSEYNQSNTSVSF